MSIFIGVCCYAPYYAPYYAPSPTVVNEFALHNAFRKACSLNDNVISVVIYITVQLVGIPYTQAVKVRNC